MPVFKGFTTSDIVLGNPTEVTTGLWTGNTGSLTAFYTSSAQATGSTSGQYYWNIYNINTSSSLADIQFAVAYGHRLGGGNTLLTTDSNATQAPMATYFQYRNLLLEPGDPQFTFSGNYNSDQIYVINVARSRLKETLDPGNWLITLTGSSGSFTFIDDSGQTLGVGNGQAGAVYNIVSGALSGSAGYTIVNSQSVGGNGGYGLVYPELGILVLNPAALAATVGYVSGGYVASSSGYFAPITTSLSNQWNHVGFLNSIRAGAYFQARSAENISSTHYFVRLQNQEFNYSNNPSFFDQTTGNVLNTDFIQNPVTYPTTIGLYDDSNELLAVGKLSSPVQKSFDKELLVRVRLDW
jgi:hypothetical protein